MISKKILASMFVIGIVALATGWGTMSYFTDTEKSTGNTFRAGYVDLALSKGSGYQNPWSGPIAEFTNMAPGQETGDINIWFKNVGPLPGVVTVQLSYSESDDPAKGSNEVGPNTFAKKVIFTYAAVDDSGTNVAGWWAQQVIDDAYSGNAGNALAESAVVAVIGSPTGYLPTLFGVAKVTLHFWDIYKGNDIIFNPNDWHKETVRLKLDENVDNRFQREGVEIILTATLTNA